jgi:hypothetical protein
VQGRLVPMAFGSVEGFRPVEGHQHREGPPPRGEGKWDGDGQDDPLMAPTAMLLSSCRRKSAGRASRSGAFLSRPLPPKGKANRVRVKGRVETPERYLVR